MANIYNFADTWDNAGVVWAGVSLDVTDSASDAASRLLKLSVNTVETFAVRKDGAVVTGSWQGTAIGPTKGGTGLTSFAAGDIIYASGVNTLAKLAAGTNGHVLTLSSGVPVWAAPGGGASAPLTLASGTITANSPALEITQTWNNAGVTFQALKINATNTASTSNSMLLDCQTGGTSVFNVDRFGRIKPVSIQLNAGVIVQGGSNGSYSATTLFGGYGSPSDAYWFGGGVIFSDGSTTARAGMFAAASNIASLRGTSPTTGAALNLLEQTAPSSPSANQVVIYAEDNGSGKTRIMALFPTGAAQQIAIEP